VRPSLGTSARWRDIESLGFPGTVERDTQVHLGQQQVCGGLRGGVGELTDDQ